MPDRSLNFNVAAIDRASKSFEKIALRLERLEGKLDKLDRKRVDVDVDVNTKGAEANLARFERQAAKAGKRSGASFLQTFAQGFGVSPYSAAIVGGGIFAALPAAAELAGGATVLALGAGLTGLGAVVAAHTKQGEAALDDFKRYAVAILNDVAAPFKDTFESIVQTGTATLEGLAQPLHDFFADTGPSVERFVNNLGQGFENLGPAIAPVGDAFNALLDEIGPKLPGLFDGIANATTRMADAIEANPQTFTDLGGWLLHVADDVTIALTALTDFANWVDSHALAKAVASSLFGGGLLDLGLQTYDKLSGHTDKAKAATDRITGSFGEEEVAAESLNTTLENLSGGALSVEQANIRFRQSVKSATKAAKDNGKTLSENTTKGLANRQVLASSASAALRLADAVKKQSGSTSKANAVLNTSRKRLVQEARHFGLTKKEADHYVTSVLGIPHVAKTKIKENARQAKGHVDALTRAIHSVPKHHHTKFTVNTKAGRRAIRGYINAISKIPSTKTTRLVTSHVGGRRTLHGTLPLNASGGYIKGPGTGTSDSIVSRLSNGEYVVRAAAVKAVGTKFLDAINQGQRAPSPRGYANGGLVTGTGSTGDVYVTVELDGAPIAARIKAAQREDARELRSQLLVGAGAR